MNKRQLLAMWVGIGLVVLLVLFPPVRYVVRGDFRYKNRFILAVPYDYQEAQASVQRTELFVVVVVVVGAIVTLKDKPRRL